MDAYQKRGKMKVKTFQYQLSVGQKREILAKLNSWLQIEPNRLFFTTCYKARAISVFVQYETPDLKDAFLYAIDQEADAVLSFVSGFLNLFSRDDLMFRIEEREKVGFSILLSMNGKISSDIEVEESEIEVEEMPKGKVEKENEERSLEEIVVAATSVPISRVMEEELLSEEVPEGIQRAPFPQLKIQPHVHIDEKVSEKEVGRKETHGYGGRKAVYDWQRLEELFKKHDGSITKIARDLGCSGAAVRRQIELKDLKKQNKNEE